MEAWSKLMLEIEDGPWPASTIKNTLKKKYSKKHFSCILSSVFNFLATLFIPYDSCISPALQNSDLSFAEILFLRIQYLILQS